MPVKIEASDPRVISFVQKYHEDKLRYGSRYYHYNREGIQVHLPRSLAEFCNAAAGCMDDGQPRGIRVMNVNPAEYLEQIFSSCQSFANFLNASEADFVGGAIRTPAKRKKIVIKVDNTVASTALHSKFKDTAGHYMKVVKAIQKQFALSDERMKVYLHSLTMNEFELAFGDLNQYLKA